MSIQQPSFPQSPQSFSPPQQQSFAPPTFQQQQSFAQQIPPQPSFQQPPPPPQQFLPPQPNSGFAPFSPGPPPPQQSFQQQQPLPPQHAFQPPQQVPQQFSSGPQFIPGPPQAGPPPVPSALPTVFQANPEMVAQAFAKAKQEQEQAASRAAGGTGKRFWTPPAPDGMVKKWDAGVPVGFASSGTIYVCPPWRAGVLPWHEVKSHFWKSQQNPGGTSVECLGKDRCPVCECRNALFRTGSEADAQRAKDMGGGSRSQYFFNMIWLDNLQSHVDGGKWLPWIFRAPHGLWTSVLMPLFELFGPDGVTNPQRFKPIRITRKKDGPKTVDVEWTAMPLDPCPLPQQYWGPLHNLHDLSTQAQGATAEKMMSAIREMQLPWTEHAAALMAAAFPQQQQQPQPVPPQQQWGVQAPPQQWQQQTSVPQGWPGQQQPGQVPPHLMSALHGR